MNYNVTREKLNELYTQLRIIILQNVREEDEYDDRFLQEMNRITYKILELKKSRKKEIKGLSRVNHKTTKIYNLHY